MRHWNPPHLSIINLVLLIFNLVLSFLLKRCRKSLIWKKKKKIVISSLKVDLSWYERACLKKTTKLFSNSFAIYFCVHYKRMKVVAKIKSTIFSVYNLCATHNIKSAKRFVYIYAAYSKKWAGSARLVID